MKKRNSAIKLIDQYCLLDSHEIEDGFKGYVTYGITDFSEWWVFSEDHSMNTAEKTIVAELILSITSCSSPPYDTEFYISSARVIADILARGSAASGK